MEIRRGGPMQILSIPDLQLTCVPGMNAGVAGEQCTQIK